MNHINDTKTENINSCTEIKETNDKGHNIYEGKYTSNYILDKPMFFKI